MCSIEEVSRPTRQYVIPIGPELESIALRHFGELGYNHQPVRDVETMRTGVMIGWLTLHDQVAVRWNGSGRIEEVPISSLRLGGNS